MSLLKRLFGSGNNNSSREMGEELSYSDSIYDEAITYFFAHFADADKIKSELIRLTDSSHNGMLIFLFTPYFLCREFMPEITYTDYYILEQGNGRLQEIKFKDSIVLTELESVIKQNWGKYIQKPNFMHLMQMHSGDFRAINEALHDGAEPEDLEALPPRIV